MDEAQTTSGNANAPKLGAKLQTECTRREKSTLEILKMGPPLWRPGKWDSVKDEELSMGMTNLAVEFYNKNHKGEEIQLVKLIALVDGITRLVGKKRSCDVAHINFMAKPMSAEDPDQSPKRYFAEVKTLNYDAPDHEVTVCDKLGADSIGGCESCLRRFKIFHPPTGFIGAPPFV